MKNFLTNLFLPERETFGKPVREKLYFNSIAMGNEEEKIKIVPVGKFPDHPDGGHEVTYNDVQEMANNCKRSGIDILFDYGHESLWNPKAEAAGWSLKEEAEAREDGLYISFPELTNNAQLKVNDKEFRYLSPVYRKGAGNRGAELLSVALTNTPFFRNEIDHFKNSFTHNNGGIKMHKSITGFFNLDETANENDVADKIDSLKESLKINSVTDFNHGNSKNNPDPDIIVNSAIETGKILPAEKELWIAYLNSSPGKATELLNSKKINSVVPGKINPGKESENLTPEEKAANFLKQQGR